MSGNNSYKIIEALADALLGNRKKALKALRKEEYGMGNGQCDYCGGGDPKPGLWHGSPYATHPCYPDGLDNCGHKHSCKIAKIIEKAGLPVTYAKKWR